MITPKTNEAFQELLNLMGTYGVPTNISRDSALRLAQVAYQEGAASSERVIENFLKGIPGLFSDTLDGKPKWLKDVAELIGKLAGAESVRAINDRVSKMGSDGVAQALKGAFDGVLAGFVESLKQEAEKRRDTKPGP